MFPKQTALSLCAPKWCAIFALAIGTGMLTTPALAQKGQGTWIALDSSAPGTPADVKLDTKATNPTYTALDIYIHGFYVETKQGPDGKYSKITVPGFGTVSQTGAPSLPTPRLNLAIVTGATSLKVAVSRADSVKSYANVMVWPQPIPERDESTGSPEVFKKDDAIYGSKGYWPAANQTQTGKLRSKLGSIQGMSAEIYPMKWDPSTRQLLVAGHMRVEFSHPGTATRQTPITKERFAMADKAFLNWTAVSAYIPANLVFYEGDFLFLYPSGYQTALLPLINQKKARGFAVTEMTTATAGTTCSSIRTAINNWYNSKPSWRDKYALLVGDTNVIPFCTAPNGAPTDDLYASTDGDDLDAEIYLGRLSADSTTDVSNQVTKILQYEDHPALFCCYDQALLVAHKEGAPGKYVGAHESVRTAAYSVPPAFSTLYGSIAGVDNADVSTEINGGTGVVAYRGHGSSTEWWSWNLLNQSYNNTDMSALSNIVQQSPVMWSFACTNSNLNSEDSISEVAMESATSRAVSYYGASEPSDTTPNHELDRQMFQAVYNLGMTTQSHAIQYAEHQMAAMTWDDNAWRYLLLGDPEMQIRRRNPLKLVIVGPISVGVCKLGPCYLDLSIFDEVGNPVPDLVVSAWKSSRAGDEVLTNQYSDRSGKAHLQIAPQTTGAIQVTVNDRAGNTVQTSIPVK